MKKFEPQSGMLLKPGQMKIGTFFGVREIGRLILTRDGTEAVGKEVEGKRRWYGRKKEG